jgi:hypothetical protein
MRNLRAPMTILAAALFALLGMDAAWHAPHYSRGALSVHADAHADGHEIPAGDAECALCSWKTSSQETVSSGGIAAPAITNAAAQRPVSKIPAGGFLRAARARAPPVFS